MTSQWIRHQLKKNLWKLLVNTTPHAKCFYEYLVKKLDRGRFLHPPTCKMRWSTSPCKIGFACYMCITYVSIGRVPMLFFLWVFGNVWSLLDGSGSSIESCRHFFKHPQPLWVKVFPSWTRLLAELDSRPALLNNLPSFSLGRAIYGYIQLHFHLWLRCSWRYTWKKVDQVH